MIAVAEMMTWTQFDYVPGTLANLIFGDVWVSGDYMVGPCTQSEDISQMWVAEYGTAEIGRFTTLEQARMAAEDHLEAR